MIGVANHKGKKRQRPMCHVVGFTLLLEIVLSLEIFVYSFLGLCQCLGVFISELALGGVLVIIIYFLAFLRSLGDFH